MDPLTFATIVQLLGMFKQERKEAKNLDHQKFMEWLEYHHHEDIKNLICSTAAIQTEVINLLRQDSATMLAKLDSINTTLASLLSQMEGFQGLSRVMLPNAELSDQAISTLRQLVASNGTNFIFQEMSGHAVFQPVDGEPFTYTDLRFLADDIDSLEKCGLIVERPSGDAYMKIYGITRAGARYIETIGQNLSQ